MTDPPVRVGPPTVAVLAAATVLVGAVPRLLLAGDALPPWLRPFIWSDVLFTWDRGLSGGRLPFRDAYFEYPPLAGYMSGLFSLAAPSALAYVAAWAVVQAVAAAAIAALLVREGSGRRAVWTWALAPQLALFGPLNFDLLAVLALVLAVRWMRSEAPLRTVAALAAGTAAKLFPAAALPVALLRGSAVAPHAVAARLAAFGVLVAACYAPAAAAPFSSLESLERYPVGIPPNFDSLWGIAAGGLAVIGVAPELPILVVTTLGLAATYVAFVLPLARTARDPAVPVALAVISLLLWSRLYSPQFSLWVLPFFALTTLPRRAFVLLVAADVAVSLTVYPITLVEREPGDPLEPLLFGVLAAGVVARHAALVVSWLAARRLSRVA